MASVGAVVAANRFGLGARPGELAAIGGDAHGWLERQIASPNEVPAELGNLPFSAEVLKGIHEARLEGPVEGQAERRRLQREVFVPEAAARARAMVRSARPFRERMVAFWANHFAVSRLRFAIAPTIGGYEREAIRPFVFGRFEDMLLAVARHPTMLVYLDNDRSIGPGSPAGRRSGRGLNENLAREILELHTLGVEGGYTQDDIVAFAGMLTGWTHGGMRSRDNIARLGPVHGGFEFRAAFHEPGAKRLLGRRYPEDGEGEGIAALKHLARHPATARHVATKLARHFIADRPPAGAVAALERAFRETGGHLGAVCRALAGLDAAWRMPAAKAKTPYELVVSALRAVAHDDPDRPWLMSTFHQLGQPPFAAPSPAGWPDTAADWLSPEALLLRIAWASDLARRLEAPRSPAQMAEDALGPALPARSQRLIEAAPWWRDSLAMLFASREFQFR